MYTYQELIKRKQEAFQQIEECKEIRNYEGIGLVLSDLLDFSKRYRLNVMQKASQDDTVKRNLVLKCVKDPLFYINTFAFTFNPRVLPYHFPFVTYPYQDRYIQTIVDCIEKGRDNITEKSRDMGYSWMNVTLQMWGFIFKGWSSLYGSYKETYVDKQGDMDSHFERLRYVVERMPNWMMPEDIILKYMSISSKHLGTEISGDSGQNFGTGGRRKFVIMDEFALWQFADKAFRKTRDISSCRIIGGTPEGRFNLYGKIMTDHKEYSHLSIEKIRLHWKDHPLKTQEWYEKEKQSRTKLDIAKELEISYEDSVTGAVYPGFTRAATFGEYKYNPKYPLYTSWDFGRDMTSIGWFQHNLDTDMYEIIDAFQKSKDDDPKIEIEFFRAFVTGEIEQGYNYNDEELNLIEKHKLWRHRYIRHFGDPYNAHSKTINAKKSVAEKLQDKGIHIFTNRQATVEDRINTTTLMFKKLCVNETLTEFIYAITQARYPETKEGNQGTAEKTKPVHDVTSHFRTMLEYFCDNAPKMPTKKIQSRSKMNQRMDKIRKKWS